MRANTKAATAASPQTSSAAAGNSIDASRAGRTTCTAGRGSPAATHSRSQHNTASNSSSPHGRQMSPTQSTSADPDSWVSALLQTREVNNNTQCDSEALSASQSVPHSHRSHHHHDPAVLTSTIVSPVTSVPVVRAARPDVSMELLCKAYRLHLPCIVAHVSAQSNDEKDAMRQTTGQLTDSLSGRIVTDTETFPPTTTTTTQSERRGSVTVNGNCEPCPSCLAGLQTLATSSTALDNCVKAIMGSGPLIVHSSPATMDKQTTNINEEWDEATSAEHASHDSVTQQSNTAALLLPRVPLWRGLGNLGNTCYLNSVLQLLFAIAPLRRAVLSDGETTGNKHDNHDSVTAVLSSTEEQASNGASAKTRHPSTMSTSLTEQQHSQSAVTAGDAVPSAETVDESLTASGLKEILAAMAYSNAGNTGVDAGPLARYLALDISAQQDAQEFLLLLLDWLHSHCGDAVRRAIDTNMSWTLLFDRCCGCCGRSAKKAELLYTLSLPLRPTLYASLDQFLQPEEVEGFTCEQCKQTATATSRQYLRSLPNVLLIHLNHFVFNLQTLQRRKLTDAVSFPRILDMTPYVQQWHQAKQQQQQQQVTSGVEGHSMNKSSTASHRVELSKSYVYELRGIVNHHGDSAQSGHYTFDAKVPCQAHNTGNSSNEMSKEAVWLRFNDAETSELKGFASSDTVSSKEAYILFYHRLDIPPTTATSAGNVSSEMISHGSTLLADSPTWDEFPTRLLRAVSAQNAQVLQERKAWQRRSEQLRRLLTRWAAAAQALFTVLPPINTLPDTPQVTSTASEANKSTAIVRSTSNIKPVSETTQPLYILPTSWLAAFGRCFLPPYVHVHTMDTTNTTNDNGNSSMMAQDSMISAAHVAQVESASAEASLTSVGRVALAGGEVSVPNVSCSTERRTSVTQGNTAGVAGDLVTVTQAAQRYALLKPSASLFCPHGKLAPWAPYKRVAPAAVPLLTAFFTECARVQQQQQDEEREANGSVCEAVQPAALLALTRDSLCTQCARMTARGVRALAASCARDAAMQAALVAAATSSSITASASAHDATAKEELVYVDESIVEAWERFVLTTTLSPAQRGVVGQAGYTGLYALWRMQAPSTTTTTTINTTPSMSFSEAATQCVKEKDESDTTACLVLPPPAVLKPLQHLFTTTTTTTNSVKRASGVGLLCPHGSLRIEAAVRVVPERLRRFWCERFAQLLNTNTSKGATTSSEVVTSEKDAVSAAVAEMESQWLPYLPVSKVTRCQLCIADSVHATGMRHRERLQKIEEMKRFPTLWTAGRLTSTQAIATLRAEVQLDAEEQPPLQLHQTRHPNVAFFKRALRESYRDAVKRWREEQEREAGRRESYIAHLTRLAEKEKMLSIPIKLAPSRRRGGNSNSSGRNNSNYFTSEAVNENSAQARLQRAQEELRKLREEAPPAFETAWGCIPTAWLAQWYRHITRNELVSNLAVIHDKDTMGQSEEAALPLISYDALRCPHGGALVEMAWLNPADGFWQGSRMRRAELLWATQAHKPTSHTAKEIQNSNNEDDQEDAALAWWPPLVIVPMAECVEVLRRYGPPDAVHKVVTITTTTTGAAAAEADSSAPTAPEQESITYEVNREKVICALERHGERVLSPTPCAACCAEMLRAFEERCASFTHGTLQLQLHLRKSKKQFYDATSTLRSQSTHTSNNNDKNTSEAAQGNAGIHHFTTLGELKARIAEHIAQQHGFSVPASELQIMRGRNRPLRYRRRDTNTTSTSNSNEEKETTTTTMTAGESAVPETATLFELDIRNGDTLVVNLTDAMAMPCAVPRYTGCSGTGASSKRSTGLLPGKGLSKKENEEEEEVWETIPPELLAPPDTTAVEKDATFAETKLHGHHHRHNSRHTESATKNDLGASASPGSYRRSSYEAGTANTKGGEEEVTSGISCPVCTYLNAHGMVQCEMCETPLPRR